MSQKKAFLLRLDARLYEQLARWAADELRSVNGQIEYILTQAVHRAGRWRGGSSGRTRVGGILPPPTAAGRIEEEV